MSSWTPTTCTVLGTMSLLCTVRKALMHSRISALKTVPSAHQLVRTSIPAVRFSSTDSKTHDDKTPAKAVPSDDEDKLADGEILLYKESQMTSILMMLGCSGVNFMYWGSQLAHYALYKDVVVEGISLAGDPMWGTFGTFATAFMLYFTKTYANNTVFQCYETADHQRVGFQMHTILGKPGRKFEVGLGSAKFLQSVNNITRSDADRAAEMSKGGLYNKVMRTSFVPSTVKGFDGNVLLDSEGKFYDKERLVALFTAPQELQKAESKETRADWKKQAFNHRKRK